jgi:c-di-GMP-binding flagellar brake protein YcgR
MMEDRRRFPRLDASLGVTWYKVSETKGYESARSDVAKNISSLGLCMIVYEKLEVGEQLSLTIELPDKNVVLTTGRVSWIRAFQLSGRDAPVNYDVGIEFLDIKQEDRRILKQFVLFPKGYK